MKFQTIRDWGRTYFLLDFLYHVGWAFVAVGLAGLLLASALLDGRFDHAMGLALVVLAGLAVILFLVWMTRDARQSAGHVRELHEKEKKPGPNGDLTEVAGVWKMPPWMG